MLKIGNTTVDSIYFGNTEISSVFVGDVQVWPTYVPPTPPPTPSNTLLVTGAGSSQLDGTYTKQQESFNNHDVYMHSSTIGYIFYADGYWRMSESIDDYTIRQEFFYANSDLTGSWANLGNLGSLPNPTVSYT